MQRRHNATRHLSLFSRSRRRARVLLRFKMTKLMQWLLCGVMFISVWFPLATNKLNNHVLEKYSDVIVLFPVFSLAFFGVYALTVIIWRVFTFNNCEVAAKELQSQIAEAKADLKEKGFIFK